jgi:uncharacterized membrane protein
MVGCTAPILRHVEGAGTALAQASETQMKFGHHIVRALLNGVLVVVPLYLVILLLLKAMSSLEELVHPIAQVLPHWLFAGDVLSLVLILLVCLVVGFLVETRTGRTARESVEQRLVRSLPGYATIRGLAQRLLGESDNKTWKPALAEIERGLVPAFIIEELEDGRFTVFVPSVPTPLAGDVFILDPERVYPVNATFAQAIRVVAQWGSGCGKLAAAIEAPRIGGAGSIGAPAPVSPRAAPDK